MPRQSEDRLNKQLNRLCYGQLEAGKICQTEITESGRTPGKYQLSIDGVPQQGEFDSEHEAMIFMAGFVAGADSRFHEMLQEKSKHIIPRYPQDGAGD